MNSKNIKTKKIEVYKLPEVPNVCNQILREVWKSKKTSIAHVIMEPGNISLLHKHSKFMEIYPPSQKTTGVNPWMNARRTLSERLVLSLVEGSESKGNASAGFRRSILKDTTGVSPWRLHYILSGNGRVRVGDKKYKIRTEDAVYIAPKEIHALENSSRKKRLEILAISSPAYADEDSFFIKH